MTLYKIICWAILLFIVSCDNKIGKNENVHEVLQKSDEENIGNKIDFDKTKVIQYLYVIDRGGVEMKQKPKNTSKTLGKYEFGAKLDVIELGKEWIGVRDRITREFSRDGYLIESTGWEKVYIKRSKTGSIDKINLINKDLNIISSFKQGEKSEYFEFGKELKDFLEIELIEKELFENKQSNAFNLLLKDTSEIKKVNGEIILECQSKLKKYIDKPDAEEDFQCYNYIGQYEFLNKYLVKGKYYENSDFKFIDKISGEETQIFCDFPYVSFDKKLIICIKSNPYDLIGELELYSIDGNETRHLMSSGFKNWMPKVKNGEMFWDTDGFFYLKVSHVKSFWKQDGNLNDYSQYIRIKVL